MSTPEIPPELIEKTYGTLFGRKPKHLSGSFYLAGDTIEGIVQCLVFLKAFSVSKNLSKLYLFFYRVR
ncbi:hypothetical protein O3M35_003973 [Rhynocoris fuscipes]|uniref:Uncharacterized protein n=1 Tax=Rhynocoris fuscipes TaxID=488301 RepID=A0AAW1CI19_9HEMI